MRIVFIFILLTLTIKCYGYNIEFFSKFNDDYLTGYIEQAYNNNHELKKANYTLEEFQYEINKQFAQFFPNLKLGSNYLGTHFPKNDRNFFGQSNSYILPLQVNFEPDFLLKNKDKVNSKRNLYNAQKENVQKTYISLLSNVANTYINLLLSDYLIKKEEIILKNKKQNLEFNNKKYDLGVIDVVELNNRKKEFNQEEVIYNNLIKNQKTALYNLSLLIGQSPNLADELKRGTIEKFEYQETIPEIINSDLIYSRPDVLEIENKLKSAKIDVTVAKKDFFPSFNITGFLAFDTVGPGNFFSWNSSFALLLAGLSQDIFKGGEKIANLKIKKAKYFALVEEYKQTDLIAIKEINDVLNQIKQDLKSEKSSKEKLDFENKNYNSSIHKQKQGVISDIEFINDKIALFQQEQLYFTTKAMRLIDYINLYKTLGGQL